MQTLEVAVEGVPRAQENLVPIAKGKIVRARRIGLGSTVSVDLCEPVEPGEGIFAGSQSAGLFLIEAVLHKNAQVEHRSFRVNAGPVCSYVLTPGMKTRYLIELKAGDEILLVNRSGVTRTGHVAGVGIDRTPMKVIELESAGRRFTTIVPNAETVRLVSDIASIPIPELEAGRVVLLRIEDGGRHFGTLVTDEMVIER